jgi:type VII secretion integral membrane protein EccD
VTVVGPRRRIDVVLPQHVPFAEQFADLARFAGLDRAALTRSPEGWVLQRLGEAPFPGSLTPAQAGVMDGELIYLQPRALEFPVAVCDDIADAIAGVHTGTDRWTARDTRRIALGAGVALLAGGVLLIARSGLAWHGVAVLAAVTAVIVVAGAAGIARASGDSGTGAALGWAALPYAFLAGLAVAVPHGASLRVASLAHAGVPGVLAGLAAVLMTSVVAVVGLPGGLACFAGVVAASGAGAGAAWFAYVDHGIGAAGAAAVIATAALAMTPLIPAAAFRLARLGLPPVPASAEDLRDDAVAIPAADTVDRARSADRFVTSAACFLGLLGAAAELALVFDRDGLAKVAGVVLAGVLLLRARIFRGRAQRLWLLVPGWGGLALLAAFVSARPGDMVVLLLMLAGLGGLIAGVGSWLAGHRPSPVWGRTADLADMGMIIALVPLALAVAGVFGSLRGL